MDLALVPAIKNKGGYHTSFRLHVHRDQAHCSNIQDWPREAYSANGCFNVARLSSLRTSMKLFDAEARHASHNDNCKVICPHNPAISD